MKTYRIVSKDSAWIEVGHQAFLLDPGEFTAQQIVDKLNLQADPFLRFYVGAKGSICYSHLTRDLEMVKGRVDL